MAGGLKRWWLLGVPTAVLLVVLAVSAVVSGAGGGGTRDATREVTGPVETASRSASASATPADPPQAPASPSSAEEDAAPPATPVPEAEGRTFLVVRAVDGDTLELASGERVRVIGIDTPERGECRYGTASRAMADLVVGKRVRLTRVAKNTDRYGRLLRYVDVGRIDAGLTLIESGLAIARYDSRDGYGFHPREPRYVEADRRTPPETCAPKATPQSTSKSTSQQGSTSSCAPGYTPCIPAYPPDLDCADVGGPIRVSGSDPHGLDRDGDGVACE